MSLHLHLLDICARDETIVSENETEKVVAYNSDSEQDDDEFQNTKKKSGNFFHDQLAKKSMIVHCFGKTADGKSVRLDAKGFKPFFFIKGIEGTRSEKERARQAVRDYIERHLSSLIKLIDIAHCERKELFGYTQGRLVSMFRLTVPSIGLFHQVKKLFLNSHSKPELKTLGGLPDVLGKPFPPGPVTVYEANLDPMLRFLHLRNLKPCGWVTVDGIDLDELTDEETNVVEIDWEDVSLCEKPPAATAPFRLASWDIECMSNTGDFPMAKKGDPIIQIGTILGRLGSAETEKHIFVLDTCDDIPEGKVYRYKKEKDLILGWFDWLSNQDVDILMGYNIFGFDEKYVWERCEQLGIEHHPQIQQLNRLHEESGVMELEEKRLSSSALGDNFLYLWTTPGRLRVDLYHYIKRGYQLPSYKLDDTSRNFLGENVKGICEKVECWQLTIGPTKQDVAVGRSVVLLNAGGDTLCEKINVVAYEAGLLSVEIPDDVEVDEVAKWAVVKDDVSPKEMFKMQREGTSADRAIIARYCVQDCQLVLDLFKKLDVFNNSMSMANVCSVPVTYIFLRGQGIKIESLMFKYCYDNQQCIMVLPGGGGGDGESYEGAIVLDPTPGFYTTPVGVADFASLYPSTIISENISHDTLVWVKDFNDKGELISMQWGSNEYDNCPGVLYTDIEYDNLIDDPEDTRKVKRKVNAGTRVCRYAQDKVGTIPQIVAGLLAARKAKRNEAAKETDPFKVALLDSEQLAYKLTANSLYGQLGSGTFKVRLRPLAASVTAYGRKQIMFAKAAIEYRYGPASGNPECCAKAETVYGDSVKGDTAIFIKREGKQPELMRIDELATLGWETWHTTKEAVELANIQIWTERGWTRVERVIRHRLAPTKKLFRLLTHTGVVDCTEDHSLVAPNGKEIKPTEVSIGTELLHSSTLAKEFGQTASAEITEREAWAMGFFLADGSCDRYEVPSGGIKYTWAINKADKALLNKAAQHLPFETKILDTLESSGVYKLAPVGDIKTPVERYRALFYNAHREKRVPSAILNASTEVIQSFMNGFYAGDGDKVGQAVGNYRWDQKGKEVSSGLAILAQRLGYTVSLNDRADKPDVFRITCTQSYQRKNPIAIKKLYEIRSDGIDYVYDLQTENHHFAVGPGNLIVHNTDSLFINFNPMNPVTKEPLVGQEALEKTIELTEEAGKYVTKALKAPHDFEFDKVYWPFIIFSKKRYVGHKYEDPKKYCLWFMGVALKRRDYAPISKRFYSAALSILLNERNVPKAAAIVQTMAKDLVEGKFGLQPLIISKSLRAEYASNPAHKILANRMAERDPGNAPASGDRIPFVYIQTKVGQEAPDLQGDRIETPSYIKEKGLKPDYMYYIDHQIANPVCQLFGIVVDQIPGFSSYKPRGGWSTNPETLIAQRETAAYHLLFKNAMESNESIHKKAFVEQFGGAVTVTPAVKRISRATVQAPVVKQTKQSTLDSLFKDAIQLDAYKAVKQKEKAEKKAEEKAEKKAAEPKTRAKKAS
jgi:DNA polymerase elongation subunit (family B)